MLKLLVGVILFSSCYHIRAQDAQTSKGDALAQFNGRQNTGDQNGMNNGRGNNNNRNVNQGNMDGKFNGQGNVLPNQRVNSFAQSVYNWRPEEFSEWLDFTLNGMFGGRPRGDSRSQRTTRRPVERTTRQPAITTPKRTEPTKPPTTTQRTTTTRHTTTKKPTTLKTATGQTTTETVTKAAVRVTEQKTRKLITLPTTSKPVTQSTTRRVPPKPAVTRGPVPIPKPITLKVTTRRPVVIRSTSIQPNLRPFVNRGSLNRPQRGPNLNILPTNRRASITEDQPVGIKSNGNGNGNDSSNNGNNNGNDNTSDNNGNDNGNNNDKDTNGVNNGNGNTSPNNGNGQGNNNRRLPVDRPNSGQSFGFAFSSNRRRFSNAGSARGSVLGNRLGENSASCSECGFEFSLRCIFCTR